MKLAAAWLALMFFCPLLNARAEEAGNGPLPRVSVAEPLLEGVTFTPGTVFRHEFVVRNEGGAPLTIAEVRTGCSCAVAGYDRLIPPGGSGRIAVAVTIHREWAGRELRRTVWALTDDPVAAQVRLVMRGRVSEMPPPDE